MKALTDKEIEQDMYEVFASQHPHEAYDLDAIKFCDYVRKATGKDISNSAIEKMIESTKSFNY